jgi:hypothetical protein
MPRIEIELNQTMLEELEAVRKETKELITLSDIASQCIECTLAERRLERLPRAHCGARIAIDLQGSYEF